MTETDTEYILNTLLDNDTIEGEKLMIGNYISSIVCDVQKGDEIIINSLTTLEEENIKIAGIINSDVQQALFLSRENVAKLMGVDANSYNAVVSDSKIEIEDGLVATTISPDSMEEQMDAVSKEINTMIINANHILLPVGIILGMLTDLFALKWAFVTLADMMGVLLPAFLSVKTVVLNVAIVSACYFGTLAVIKRKTNNVDMVECLKDNRE